MTSRPDGGQEQLELSVGSAPIEVPGSEDAAITGTDTHMLEARQSAARLSAIWAAWADAVGWISELTDEAGLRRRTKGRPLAGTVAWRRRIGGRSGVDVDLPQGTYSDDTQLRLAVCRAIGPRGFDVETFSRIELTVWPSYALGGGVGTKAAAVSMARPGARWSANRPENYENAGGNGAAMRVQPHAWRPLVDSRALLMEVLRDSVITHGHPRAILGAGLQALAVADLMPGGDGALNRKGSEAIPYLVDELQRFEDLPYEDPELAAFWLPNWRHEELGDWRNAVQATLSEMRTETSDVLEAFRESLDPESGYRDVVQRLDLKDPRHRGSGSRTSIAALSAFLLARRYDMAPEKMLTVVVNEIGTDTDTIGTMAGALLGCITSNLPPTPVLDWKYIGEEAARVASSLEPVEGRVRYPDLLAWEPPRTQADALESAGTQYFVVGLGQAEAVAPVVSTKRGDFAWEWVRTAFGQTLLMKRRPELAAVTPGNQAAPIPPTTNDETSSRPNPRRPKSSEATIRPVSPTTSGPAKLREPQRRAPDSRDDPLSVALHRVRASDFDPRVVGQMLIRLASDVSPELASAFGALVAQEISQMRRGRSR